jgi:hypothetical protein
LARQILWEDAKLAEDIRPPSWPVQLGWTVPQRGCTTLCRYKATILISTAGLNRSSEKMHNSLQIQGHHLDKHSWAEQILREDAQLATDTRPPCWLIQLGWTDPQRGCTTLCRYKATILTSTAGLNRSSEKMHNSLQIQGHLVDWYSCAEQILREDAQLSADTRPPSWPVQLG